MMLQAIELTNFKCYEALDLPCSALTVLTGYNSAGKSTVLEALLLLAQGLRSAAKARSCLSTETWSVWAAKTTCCATARRSRTSRLA